MSYQVIANGQDHSVSEPLPTSIVVAYTDVNFSLCKTHEMTRPSNIPYRIVRRAGDHYKYSRASKKSKLWIHTYPNGIKAQLDYILINKKWINSAHNCEAYSSFEGVSSDHRIVSCKIQLSLRANKRKTSKIPRCDWTQFMCNTNIQDKYTVTVRNRFQILQTDNNNNDPNETYMNFVKAHKQAAQECIPLKPKRQQKIPWENEEVQHKRKTLKQAAHTKSNCPTQGNIKIYRNNRKDLEETYRIEQQKYIQNQIDTITTAAKNQQSSLAWQTVNEISGNTPKVENLEIQNIIDYELPIKKVYTQSTIKIWTQGCIIPFPKKSDLSLATNYRGITFTATAAKIYNAMLRDRIQPEIEKILRPHQNGFRLNRAITGEIITIRRLIEIKAKNLNAVILFVDFSKAFDSINVKWLKS
ncbi:uncharacterized protein LOC134765253 [Penaeus indicus]|uniref:uncharacterized protein LOC134765253 n=1 Tax=Penaeus indicus TaxID=29960 RepID=UPI00300D7745